jgi:O-antigen/teichoic acid export membrane protein
MREEILNLSKHTLIYGVGIVIGKAVSFIMLPIYTRCLTPVDYGILELLEMTIDVIAMIAGIGLAAGVFKFYSEYENPEDKKEVISTVAIMMMIISSITGILGFIFSNNISQLIFGRVNNSLYFKLFIIIYFLQSVSIIPLLFIRAIQNSKLFVLISLIKLSMLFPLNVYFVVILKMNVIGVIYSTLLTSFVIGLYLSIYIFRKTGFRFSISKCKRLIKFGYPLVFWSLGNFVLTFSDRYFLNNFYDLKTVGIYALAYKFGFLLTALAYVPFGQIWEPQRFEIVKQENAPLIFKKVFLYLNIILISMSLIIAIFVKDILTIMADPSYLEAYKIVPIILFAYILWTWTAFCNFGLLLKEKTNLNALSAVIAVVSVVLLNFLLIPKYGAYGAAWATFGAFLIRFTVVFILSQKYYSINYGWDKLFKLISASVIIYLTRFFLNNSSLILSLIINIGLLSLYSIVIYKYLLEKSEKSFIKKLIQRPLLLSTLLSQGKTYGFNKREL